MNESKSGNRTKAVSTGITGFDGILDGGYASNRVHLIEGQPGTGKTTLALQFLLDGARKGERCLYIARSGQGYGLGLRARRRGHGGAPYISGCS
jgi:circadian clock protein KaiC